MSELKSLIDTTQHNFLVRIKAGPMDVLPTEMILPADRRNGAERAAYFEQDFDARIAIYG